MAEGGVRDLLVQLRLDNKNFRTAITEAKGDVALLKAQFKEAESDSSLQDASKTLQENLSAQIEALKGQAEKYEEQIGKLRTALGTLGEDSKAGQGVLGDIQKLEKQLSLTNAEVNTLETKLNDLKFDALIDNIGKVTQLAEDLKMAYSGFFGWTDEAADSADEAYTRRQYLMAGVQEATDMNAEQMKAFQAWQEQVISTSIPLTFEQISAVAKAAGAAMDVSMEELQEFILLYSKIQATTDLQGEEGVGALATIIALFHMAKEEYAGFGSALAVLGDASRAGEADILAIAERAASAVALFGGAEQDLIALAAAVGHFGQENEAGGSALMRTFTNMGTAAEFGKNQYEGILQQIRALYPEMESFYDLSVAIAGKEVNSGTVASLLGMNASDFQQMMDTAIMLEKYVQYMGDGASIQSFVEGWENNSTEHFINFWTQVGAMAQRGDFFVFDVLSNLGFNGVRDKTTLANLTNMGQQMLVFLELSRQAYAEGTKLDEKYGNFLNTEESRRTINANATENMYAAMGQGVLMIRRPFEDLWADMQKNFVENMPDWVLTGAGAAVEGLSALGDFISGVGNLAEDVYFSGQVIQDIKNMNWKQVGSSLAPLAKAAGVGIGSAAAIAGMIILGNVVNDIAYDTNQIAQNLNGIKIVVDEESKNQALQAIQEVQAASDRLANKETSEEWAKISRVVKAGYGDMEMFGTAIAYEQALVEKQLHDLTVSYGLQIDELNSQIIAASEAGDDALAAALATKREETAAEWKDEADAVRDAYSLALSQVFNGMLGQREGMAEKLEQLNKDYDLLALLLGINEKALSGTAVSQEYMAAYEAMLKGGLISQGDYDWLIQNSLDSYARELYGWGAKIKSLLGRMVPTVAALFEDPQLYGLFTSAMESGIFENADVSQLEGALAGVLAAIDLKKVAAQGGGNVYSWDNGILQLLVNALEENKNLTGPAVQEVRDAVIEQMQEVFSENGKSSGATAVGAMVTGNLATGILSGKADAVSAMQDVIAAVQAEAMNSAPLIAALMQMGTGIGLAGAAGAGSYHGGTQNTWNQSFTVTGSTIKDQQNIRKLAQEVMKEMRRTGKSIGQ